MLTSSDKRYTALLRLGITTDTQGIGGKVLVSRTVDVTDERISEVIGAFKGDIFQIPPMYSAIKVKGKKLYEYAREGVEIKRPPRKVTIYEINMLAREGNDIRLDIKCSKGTYIGRCATTSGSGSVAEAVWRTLYAPKPPFLPLKMRKGLKQSKNSG